MVDKSNSDLHNGQNDLSTLTTFNISKQSKSFLLRLVTVVSQYNFTTEQNQHVRKLTNKDITRIVKQWLKKKPVRKIAELFQVTRQRIYQIINKFRETDKIPFLRKSGREPKQIPKETEELVIKAHKKFNLGPVHLERKIEEIYSIHIPHNTVYKILLKNGLVEKNMKKKKQRKWVRFERKHSMSLCQRLEASNSEWRGKTVNSFHRRCKQIGNLLWGI